MNWLREVLSVRRKTHCGKKVHKIGYRLSKDQWLAENTLPYIFLHLDLEDLLNVSQVCQMWHRIISERFLQHKFIPTCAKHMENIFRKHGNNIHCLQLVDIHVMKLEGCILEQVENSDYFSVRDLHSRELPLWSRERCTFPLKTTFARKTLCALRFYTDRIILVEDPLKPQPNMNNIFYWEQLLCMKNLTCLELGFDIPNNFGTKVLQLLKNLKILKLHIYDGVDEHIFKSISSLDHLIELVILKVHVNDDLTTYLPLLKPVQKLTILIRDPCDTKYFYLLKSVIKMTSLKYFTWVVDDATASSEFFGDNCQELLNIKSANSDQNIIESCLGDLFIRVKTRLLLADCQYFPKLEKDFEKCFRCINEKRNPVVWEF